MSVFVLSHLCVSTLLPVHQDAKQTYKDSIQLRKQLESSVHLNVSCKGYLRGLLPKLKATDSLKERLMAGK